MLDGDRDEMVALRAALAEAERELGDVPDLREQIASLRGEEARAHELETRLAAAEAQVIQLDAYAKDRDAELAQIRNSPVWRALERTRSANRLWRR